MFVCICVFISQLCQLKRSRNNNQAIGREPAGAQAGYAHTMDSAERVSAP